MKKLKFLLFAVAAMALVLTTSCRDNNDQVERTETVIQVRIDTVGLQTSFHVERFTPFLITPNVFIHLQNNIDNQVTIEEVGTMNINQMNFVWEIFPAVGGQRDTIATTLALDAILTQPAGAWTLLFTAIHNQSGLRDFVTFTIETEGDLPNGLLVLYERNGNTDVGIITNDWLIRDAEERVGFGLFSAINGRQLAGRPVNIVHSLSVLTGGTSGGILQPGGSNEGHIMITSERDFVLVCAVNFNNTLFDEPREVTTVFDWDFLFVDPPTTRRVSAFSATQQRREIIINNGEAHLVNWGTTGTNRMNTQFGLSVLPGTSGTLAPWVTNWTSSDILGVVFCQTGRRFMALPRDGAQVISSFQDQTPPSGGFDVNNVGMEMLFSAIGNQNFEHSIMRDGNNFALLLSNFATPGGNLFTTSTDIGRRKHDMTGRPGIDQITSLATPVTGEFIFYSCQNAVHIFRYNDATPYALAWTAPAGEVITAIRMHEHVSNVVRQLRMINRNQILHVATWNQASQTGTVRMFWVDPLDGTFSGESRVYTGFGRIVDMAYKFPTTTMN